jgi:hypothetical protein
MSDDNEIEDIKFSLQNPRTHFCPMGQVLLAIQGSLAAAPTVEPRAILYPRELLDPAIFMITNAIKETIMTNPIPVPSFNAIASDDTWEI